MKKIINGKKYDTETATELGEWYNTRDKSDFNNCSEVLYRKKTGEYFLHGTGGPLSKYSVPMPNNAMGGSSVIEPLTENEAKKWAEKYLEGDEYEAIFGEVEE